MERGQVVLARRRNGARETAMFAGAFLAQILMGGLFLGVLFHIVLTR